MVLTVFVSSRSDLKDERRVVAAAVEDLGLRADIFEEWSALSEAPEAASIAAVREADMLVLLLGSSYGTLASTGRAIIHEEYLAAREKKIPVLAFRINDADPEPHQLEFIGVIQGDQTIHPVQSLADLKAEVRRAITRELVRQRGVASPEMAAPVVEVGRPSDATSWITIDLQAEEIGHLRDALSRHAAEQLTHARAVFRSGRTDDAVASLEKLREEPEWRRIDASMRSRILTVLATFKHSAGATAAEVEGIPNDAKSIDVKGDFSNIDALLVYERDGAAAAVERLDVVRTIQTFNLKIALLLELDRRQDAAALLAAPPESIQPDAETMRLRAFVALADGDAEAAIRILDDALKTDPQSESLRVAASIARVASTITAAERPRHPHPWLAPIDPAFVITTEEALARLDEAAATLDDMIMTSQRRGVALRQMQAWRLAAVALHPSRRERARSVASTLLEADPADPTALVWSVAYSFDINIERAIAALARPEEPITPTRVVGVVAAIEASGDFSRAEALLEEQRPIFEDEEDLWRFWRVRLLADMRRFEDAATLAKEIARTDLRGAAVLLVATARGHESDDSDEYLALVDRVDPDYNGLVARARLGRWSEIVEKSIELVANDPSAAAIRLAATALFRVREHERSLQLLKEHSILWSQSSLAIDLRRLTIDNQIVLGLFPEALQGAQELFDATKSGRDLVLIIRVAIAAGHQKDARFWASQLLDLETGEVAVGDLLDVSRMVAIEDRELARHLWLRAYEIGLPDDTLAFAMARAYALGLDEEGNQLFAILQSTPTATGSFRPVSVEELLAMQREASDALASTYRAYAAGDIPLAMLIAATRRSLAEIYDTQFTEARRSAVGSMAPLYVRHGGRMLAAHLSLEKIRTLTLDVSSLLLTEHLGVLDAIEKRFDSLRVSPVTCAALAEQQDRLRSPQPRIDEANATILRLVEEGRITQLCKTAPSGVVAELEPRLGHEWAATMETAIVNDGYVVSELPQLDLQSAVQVELPAELRDRIRTPAQFAEPVKGYPVPPGAPLYLIGSTAVTLAYEKKLELLATERTVFVGESAITSARAESERRASRDAVARRLANLSERVGVGLSSGKYRTFHVIESDETREPADLTTRALVDLLRARGEAQHAFVIDDRLVNSQLELAGCPVVTLPTVLAELRRSEHLDDDDYFLILLQLRRSNYRYIDLDGDEIVYWLTKVKIVGGVVDESEPLQILRVYLNAALSDRNLRVAPLPMTNAQRAFGEGAFAMNSAMAVNRALSEIWSLSNVTSEDRMAYSDWILRSLYTGSYGVHHLYGGFNKPRLLMASDLGDLLVPTSAILGDDGFDFERGLAFTRWVEGRIVDYRLDANPDLLPDVVSHVNQLLTETVSGHGEVGRKVVHAVYSILPDPVRMTGANDQVFAKAVNLQTRPSIRVADFEFGADEFWLTIEDIRTKPEVVIRTNLGTDVHVAIAPANVGEGLIFDDGSGKRLFPDPTFISLGFDPVEKQRQHLHEHPEIFDLPDDLLNAAIEAVLKLPTLRERLERLKEIKQGSAASNYDSLRRTLGHAVITVNELVPQTGSLLRHYLPGYVHGTELDPAAAFAPILERGDLLDVLRRAVVLPILLPDALFERFSAEPEEKRHAIVVNLAGEAASPIVRAQVAILGYVSASEADRQLASRLIGELLDSAMAPQVELFKRVLLWVYWRLSFDESLAPDSRLLLAWAHASRLAGLFMTTDVDMSQLNYLFLAQGQTFSDDIWTRSDATHDVLHPLMSNGVRTVCSAVTHAALSVPLEADRLDIGRRLHDALFGKALTYPVPLMRDLTLATNVTGSFLTRDIADALRPVDETAAALLSHETKVDMLRKAMLDIDGGENPSLAWRAISAIIGHLPPPPDVRSWLEKFVVSPALENLAATDAAIDALTVLAEVHPHFGDDFRQRVEEAAIAAATRWQEQITSLADSATSQAADSWTTIAASLAARPESREQTGAALGRSLQRFIDASPAVASSALAMLTMLPMRLPLEYLPALWPAVIAARAAPNLRKSS